MIEKIKLKKPLEITELEKKVKTFRHSRYLRRIEGINLFHLDR